MRTFPHQFGDVMDILQTMRPQADDAGTRERVHAAMLAHAVGDVDRLLEAAVLAQTDWRDMLMSVPEFAHEGWDYHLDQMLGPEDEGARA